MSIGETEEALTDALAEDLRGALSRIPPGEDTLERFRTEVLGYFERPDHIAVEVTSDLGTAAMSATVRPMTAYGRVLLERSRREIAAAA